MRVPSGSDVGCGVGLIVGDTEGDIVGPSVWMGSGVEVVEVEVDELVELEVLDDSDGATVGMSLGRSVGDNDGL